MTSLQTFELQSSQGKSVGHAVLYTPQIILENKSASRCTAQQRKSTTILLKTGSEIENVPIQTAELQLKKTK